MIFPTNNNAAYQTRLDLLYGMTAWLGWAFCMCIPFFINMQPETLLLFYAILASEAAVLLWCYQVKRRVKADYKYFIAELAQPIAAVGILILTGHAGLYFFFPLFFLQIVGVVALFRYQHVLLIFAFTAIATAYLFFLTDSFNLGDSQRFIAGSVFLASLALGAFYVYIAFRQVAEVLSEVEREKISFIQNASHELRTPLTVIKGVAGLLRDRRLMVWIPKNAVGRASVDEELMEHFESATSDLEHITERLNENSKKRLGVGSSVQPASEN